jgi:molybdopterin/thiamine biosynthesis adenylyltransferase
MAIPSSLQRRLPDMTIENRRHLAESSVLVIGTDTLGLAALRYLAAAGVGSIGLLDTTPAPAASSPAAAGSDAGSDAAAAETSLTEELSAAVAAVDLATTVTVHTERLGRRSNTDAAAAIIDGYNLVVDASDTVPVRFLVADTCAALGLPLVWASVARFNGRLAVFPGVGGAPGTGFRDLFPAQEAAAEARYAPDYLLGALRGQLGALMAAEAVKVLANVGEPLNGRVLEIDADSGRFSEISIAEAASGNVDA